MKHGLLVEHSDFACAHVKWKASQPTEPILNACIGGKFPRNDALIWGQAYSQIYGVPKVKNINEESANFQLVNAAFPRLAQKLKLYWGHSEFATLMKELQHECSDRPRAGFSEEVLFALADLETEHDSLYPHLASNVPSVWSILRR